MADLHSTRSLLDDLVANLREDLPGGALGDTLNRLLWITDDNGSNIIVVLREWLECGDVRRVEAALSIEDGWLYDDRDVLAGKLSAIARRWPHLIPRIDAILGAYDRQFKR